jgi:hypothetical protein
MSNVKQRNSPLDGAWSVISAEGVDLLANLIARNTRVKRQFRRSVPFSRMHLLFRFRERHFFEAGAPYFGYS